MKKALPIILLLLIATWAGATYLVSDQVEKNYQTAVNQVNQKLSSDFPLLSLKPQSFKKGFLASDATSRIVGTGDSKEGITLNHKIYHGPVMMTPEGIKTGSSYIVTTIDLTSLPNEAREAISRMTSSDKPVVISLLTGTGKTFDIDVHVVPLAAKSSGEGEPNIDFAGLDGTIHTDIDGSFLNGEFNSGKLTLEDNQSKGHIVMAPAAMNFDITDMYKGTALSGTTKTSIPEVMVQSPDFTAKLQDLTVASASKTESGKTSGRINIDIAALQAEAKGKPATLPESKISLASSFDEIDTAALKHLLDAQEKINTLQMQSIAQAIKNGEAPKPDDQVLTATITGYVKSAIELIKPGIHASSRLSMSNQEGNANLKLELAYADSRDLTQLKTIRELITAFKGQLDIGADNRLLSALSLDKLAAMPVSMGMATQDNGRIKSLIKLEKGEVTVNGAPVPFLKMLGPMLDQPSPIPAMVATY